MSYNSYPVNLKYLYLVMSVVYILAVHLWLTLFGCWLIDDFM